MTTERRLPRQRSDDKKWETQYAEIVKVVQTISTIGPADDNSSLAQPTPLQVLPTFLTYGAYDEPILG